MRAEVEAELGKVVRALGEFYARETHLLDKDLGERVLTHRLAVHLENQFAGWDVDCDYNRLGERRLRLPKGSIVSTDDDSGKSVFPISSCTIARCRKTCWRSSCAKPPIISQLNTTDTSCAR